MTETEEKSNRISRMLGLAFSERSAVAAEVTSGPGGLELTRAAAFAFPDGVGLTNADALGTALGQFLKDNGFSTRSAVLGIPAKWVLSKPKEVPPADDATAAEVLRLGAEGEFSADLKDLAFDYAGQTNASSPSTVLLMAVPSRYVQQVMGIAAAARLRPTAVTPIAAALGAATGRRSKSAAVLSIGPGGAEYTAQRGVIPVVMRHLGPPAASVPMLMAELRRLSAMSPAATSFASNGNGNGHGTNGSHAANGRTGREVILWDDVGMPAAARLAVGAALGDALADGTLASFGVTDARDPAARDPHVSAAVALALAGLRNEGPPVDFLHSRLAPPKPQRIKRQTLLAIIAGACVLIAVIALFVDLNGKRNELAGLQADLKKKDPEVKVAKAAVARIAYAKAWHAGQPRYLACLRDVALVIPEEGDVFLTGFNLRDNMKGTLSGKSVSVDRVTSLSDKLKATKRFADVDTSFDQASGGTGTGAAARSAREVSFTMKFRYVPSKEPESAEPAAATQPTNGGSEGGSRNRSGESRQRSSSGRR